MLVNLELYAVHGRIAIAIFITTNLVDYAYRAEGGGGGGTRDKKADRTRTQHGFCKLTAGYMEWVSVV